uniref:Uncharacterized protein n=1 Tax=Anguilla anguilla TaxID=7936 RepID=A0A0E9RMG0_ANGAN
MYTNAKINKVYISEPGFYIRVNSINPYVFSWKPMYTNAKINKVYISEDGPYVRVN